MKKLARLLVRKDKTAGLYWPLVEEHLEPGVYEINDVNGELMIQRIGDSGGSPGVLAGRVGDICLHPECLMTPEEAEIRRKMEQSE